MYTFHEGYQRILGMDIEGIPSRTAGLRNAKPMSEVIDLTGKTAIVVGGAMGLGACVVNRFCEAGASVVVADIAQEFADKLLEFTDSKGYDVKFINTDVCKRDQITAAVDFTVAEYGKIDILAYSAASWHHRLLDEVTEESWKEGLDINLTGSLFFIQEVVRVMEKQETGGKIINIASVAGIPAVPPVMYDYVAAKAAVIALTKSLAKVLKPKGININCVIPGGMMTPGAITTQATDAAKELRSTEKMTTPATDPDEVARVVFMLATQVSDFMYGSFVIADGGANLSIE